MTVFLPENRKSSELFFHKNKFTALLFVSLSYCCYASTGILFSMIALTSSTLFFVANAI